MNKPLLAPQQEEDLRQLLTVLEGENIEAVIIGAFAIRAHLPDIDRQTEDVDLTASS